MRFAPCALFLVFAAGVAAACSAFIPFDEYAGSAATSPPPADAAGDAPVVPGEGGTPDAGPTCKDVDLRTDPKNCQACGRVCDSCAGSRCPIELLDDGTGNITSIDFGLHDSDAGSVDLYFTRANGLLARMDLDGGRYEDSGSAGIGPVDFGATVALVGTRQFGIDLVARDHFDAGPTHILPQRSSLGPLLYDPNNVFFSDDDGMYFAKVTQDASVTQLSDASAIGLTAYNGVSYWTDGTGVVQRMSTKTPGTLLETLRPAPLLANVTGIAVAKGHIYLAQRSQGLQVYDYDDQSTAKLARLVPIDDPELVIADDTHVYVYNAQPAAGHRQIRRYEPDGTGELIIADTLTGVRAMVVGASYLYFTDQTKLLRIVK